MKNGKEEAERLQRESAQRRAEHEHEIEAREHERQATAAEREEAVQKRLATLRINHEAQRLLSSEITRARRFDLPTPGWNAEAFLEESEAEPEAVVKDLHFRGNNTLLVAQYKTGKTTLEVNLAASLVDGKPFLGQFDTYLPYGRVAFFNYEMDTKQFRHWLNQHEIENVDRILPLNLRGYRLAFWDDEEMNRLAEWLLANEVGFIIMDPAARAWRGLVDNEGDNVQLSEFFGAIDELKRLADVSNFLLAVHTPRDADLDRARGGGEIEAWPDGNWYYSKARGGVTRVLRAEGRDIELPETALEFEKSTRTLKAVGTTVDAKFEEGVKTAIEVIQVHKTFSSTKEFADMIKGATGEKRKWIKEAVRRGKVLEKQNGQHKRYDAIGVDTDGE